MPRRRVGTHCMTGRTLLWHDDSGDLSTRSEVVADILQLHRHL